MGFELLGSSVVCGHVYQTPTAAVHRLQYGIGNQHFSTLNLTTLVAQALCWLGGAKVLVYLFAFLHSTPNACSGAGRQIPHSRCTNMT